MLSKKSLIAAVVIVVLILIAGCIYNGYQDQVYRETKLSTTLDHEWGRVPAVPTLRMKVDTVASAEFTRFTIGDNVRVACRVVHAYTTSDGYNWRLAYLQFQNDSTAQALWQDMYTEYGPPTKGAINGQPMQYYRLSNTIVGRDSESIMIMSISEMLRTNPEFLEYFPRQLVIKGGK